MKVTSLAVFLCVFYQQNLAIFSSVYFKNNNTLKRPRRSTTTDLGKDALREILVKNGLSGTMNENSFSNGRERRRKIRSVNKSSSMNNNSSCRLRETIMSTYNFEYGYLNQTTVSIKRCFGGNKDPKNYQCQPKKQRLKCYRLRLNSSNTTEYTLGYLEHLECEEYCICRRGNCNGKKPVKPMLCPVGYRASTNCTCISQYGTSILYRHLGIISDTTTSLSDRCDQEKDKHPHAKVFYLNYTTKDDDKFGV